MGQASQHAVSHDKVGRGRAKFNWRGDRVDEGARLERECRATYRGFESHSLRHFGSHEGPHETFVFDISGASYYSWS